jgi:hypothetical protein
VAEWPLWVAPALQEFSVNLCGRYCQYRRLSGLFVRWCSAGLDEFRERGSNRLVAIQAYLDYLFTREASLVDPVALASMSGSRT